MASRTTNILFALTAVATVVMVAGCGYSDSYDYVKVSGKVTFEDGAPIKANRINVVFVPQDVPETDARKPRHGMTELNVADGTFDSVTSHSYGDGILPGRHKVMIVVIGPLQKSEVLPLEYSDPEKTPLEVDTADAPFHFKIKRLM